VLAVEVSGQIRELSLGPLVVVIAQGWLLVVRALAGAPGAVSLGTRAAAERPAGRRTEAARATLMAPATAGADRRGEMTEPVHDAAPAQDVTAADAPPATPTWVKALGIVLALVVLLVLTRALFGGGLAGHGPGMHGG
jgi:hypothetical protein